MNEYSQCETMFLFKKGNSREKGLLFEFQRLWRYVSCERWRAGCTRGWGGCAYLKAEAEFRGCAVLLLARKQGEDAAVLQVSQQLQVSGLLQNKKAIGDW